MSICQVSSTRNGVVSWEIGSDRNTTTSSISKLADPVPYFELWIGYIFQYYYRISQRESNVTPSTKGNIIWVLLYQGSSLQHQRTSPYFVKPTSKIIRGKASQFSRSLISKVEEQIRRSIPLQGYLWPTFLSYLRLHF